MFLFGNSSLPKQALRPRMFTEAYRLQHRVSGLLDRFETIVFAWTHFVVRHSAYIPSCYPSLKPTRSRAGDINHIPTPVFFSSSIPGCVFKKSAEEFHDRPLSGLLHPKLRGRDNMCPFLLCLARHVRNWSILVHTPERLPKLSPVPRNAHEIENMTVVFRLLRPCGL